MKTPHAFALVALLVFVPIVTPGCSDSGEPEDATQATDINGRTIAELTIEGTSTIKVESTAQLRARLEYADGTSRDVTEDQNILWNTDDPGLVTVTNAGLITAEKIGVTKITAEYRRIVASHTVAVSP